MDYIAQPKDYWIATNAINITRNALGSPNRIQCSVASGAAILCYIEGVAGLGYDNGHRFRTWLLTISPTYFNSNTEKYVYVAIPRTAEVGTQAVVVFPSEQLDIYGVNADDEQVGSTDYYYIWLQGILTATDGTSNREWQQTIDFGKKGTDEDLYDDTSSDWYQYSRVSGLVTFLKNIAMKAGTTFKNLILGNKELKGVATSDVAYTDSDVLVATPGYVESQYLSKTHESTAQEQVGFLKGLWVKAKNLFGIDANGNATLNSVTSDTYNDDNIGGYGYHVYKDANGNGHVCTDILDVRKKARFTELEIRRLSYINADQVQSMAASKVEKVLPIAADGTVISSDDTTTTVVAYRCLAVADDGSTATKNGWALGDQARCQTFNISTPGNYQNVENRFYWRLVVRVGQCYDNGTIYPSQEEHDGKVYHFFDLANIMDVTADAGDEFDDFFADGHATEDVYEGYMITLVNNERTNLNDIPATEDAVVQMGNRIDTDRMGFFITKADNLHTGPYIYAGVNQFSLVGKMITKITPYEVLISARKLKVFSDPNAGDASPLTHYRGEWAPVNGVNPTSYYYDEWDFQGSRWLCLYQGAEGTTEAPGTTPANWKEISLKGDAGTGYKLLPSPNVIKTKQTGENTYDPATASLTCGYVKNVGGTITSVANATALIDNKYVIYFRRKSRGGDYESKYWFYTDSKARAFLSSLSLSGYDATEFYLAENSLTPSLDVLTRATFLNSLSGVIDNIIAPVVADGSDGTSPIVADITNQMTGVACDKDGNVAGSSDKSLTTTVRMYKGSTLQTGGFTSITCKINGTTLGTDYVNENTPRKYYKVSLDTENNSLTGGVTITVKSGTNIDGKTEVEIVVVMSIDGTAVTRTVTFVINGVRAGADGSPATIYELLPSKDAISFGSGTTSQNMYMELLKIVGDSANTIARNYAESSDIYVLYGTTNAPDEDDAKYYIGQTGNTYHSDVQKWGVDNDSEDSTLTFGGANNNTATILSTATFTQIYLALYRKVTAGGTTSYVLLDRETIPIVRDGQAMRENLIDNSEPKSTFIVSESTERDNSTDHVRFGSTDKSYEAAKIPANGSKVSGQARVTIQGCSFKSNINGTNVKNGQYYGHVVLYFQSVQSSTGKAWLSIAEFDVYGNGTYDVKTENITINSNGGTWDERVLWRIDNFNDAGTISFERVKLEVGDKCSAWCLSENDKKGNDGDDGLDAWTLTVNPSPIIIEQNIDDESDFGLPIKISFSAKCGDNTATVGTIESGNVSNNLGLTISRVTTGTDYNNGVRLKITAYNKNSQTGKYVTNGYITCTVPLSYGTARTTSMDVRIQVGVNLLGEWETKIVGDAETSVATKLTNAVIDGELNTFQQVGTYIRSASENTAMLTETVGSRYNGNNLFGFSKGAIFDGAVPFVQGYGMACVWNNGQAYSRVWNLDFGGKTGYYVVTCEIKAQSAANIRFFLADIAPVSGSGLTKVGDELKVAATTQWKKITAVYNLTAVDAANSNGQLVIRDGSTSNNVFIRKLQIERGSVPSDFGICKEDEMNISDPVNGITWSSTANSFTEVTSGSEGPGGTSNYITNSYNGSVVHPASDSNIEVASSGIHVDGGIYTLSFWAKSNAVGNIMHCFCVDATNSQTYNGVMPNYITPYYGDIEPGQQEGMSKWGDVGIKLTKEWRKYYVHYYVSGPSNNMYIVPMRIIGNETGGQTGTYYIAQIKLEKGYVTSANRTEYQTVMKQTAHNIDFSVLVNSMEKAGIHLYTSNNTTPESEDEIDEGVIDLVAGKVNFKSSNGAVNPYMSIDQNGKLIVDSITATNGDFSGTIHATSGDFTDLTSQDKHVAIVGTPNSTNNYWRGLAIGDDPINADGDLATIGGRFTNASASTGYGYLVIAKNTGSGSLAMVTIDGNDGSVGCGVLKTQRIETSLTIAPGNYDCDSGGFVDSKVVCKYSGTRTIKLPLATTAREIWVRQIETGTTNVYDATGTTLVGSVTKADGWKLFVYIPQIGWS